MVEHRSSDNAGAASARGSNHLLNALDKEKQPKHPGPDLIQLPSVEEETAGEEEEDVGCHVCEGMSTWIFKHTHYTVHTVMCVHMNIKM